jgi:hypothetical protein
MKTEFEIIKNHLLSNTSHLKFFIAVMTILKKFSSILTKITPQVNVLNACIEKEDIGFKVIRKSNLSVLKKKADKARDTIVLGMKDAIKSALRHFDEEVSEAARQLKIVFDAYNSKSIIDLPFDDETMVINSLLDEYEGKYAVYVEQVGLTPWVKELRLRNNAFDYLATTYNEQKAEKPTVQAKDLRKDTDKAYHDIITIISSFIIMEGETEYAPLVSELNTLIKQYNDRIAQHRGHLEAAKKKAKEEIEKKGDVTPNTTIPNTATPDTTTPDITKSNTVTIEVKKENNTTLDITKK